MVSLLKNIFLLVVISGFIFSCGRKSIPLPPLTVVPEPIKDLKSIVRHEGVLLIWAPPERNNDGTPLENLMGFKVLRSEVPVDVECKECVEIFEPISDVLYTFPSESAGKMDGGFFKFFDNDLKYGRRYRYKVLSYNTTGYLSPDSEIIDIFWDIAPSPPSSLEGESGDRFVHLRWTPPSDLVDGGPLLGLKGFNIYRRTMGTSYSLFPINDEVVANNYYIDTVLENGRTYYYMIRSVREVNGTLIEGPPSEEITVVPMDRVPPQPPRGLVAIPEKNAIMLKWNAGLESDLLGYNIYRRESTKKSWMRLNKGIVKDTTFSDSAVKKGVVYYYYITAIDSAPSPNESNPSKEVKAFLR